MKNWTPKFNRINPLRGANLSFAADGRGYEKGLLHDSRICGTA